MVKNFEMAEPERESIVNSISSKKNKPTGFTNFAFESIMERKIEDDLGSASEQRREAGR